ncbi:hypothetical protein GCM10027578_23460 [Spirosoma luteolum]
MSFSTSRELTILKLDLSAKAKNGINFILAAIIVWSLVTVVWTLPYTTNTKAIFTFIIGSLLLPLAWLFSRLLGTSWTIPDNPLQPLGLWLNLAQLLYFPILIFVFLRHVDYFLLVYVVITGAHFFPYSWFYSTRSYAVMAGLISVGTMLLGLYTQPEQAFLMPALLVGCLVILVIWNVADYRKSAQLYQAALNA